MRPRTPQHLADWLGVFIYRKKDYWFGSRVKPIWNGYNYEVLENPLEIEITFYSKDILFIGSDFESLHQPRKEQV